MDFAVPLVRGTLIKRHKRFLADVSLETGEAVTAHCPNSGSMKTVNAPGSEVWLSPATAPGRKLPFTWELIRVGETLVGINTGRPNGLVAEAVQDGTIAELSGYPTIRREVRYGRNSRIDLLLEAPDRPPCYVEVKNVTLRRGDGPEAPVEFPDSVTERGTKHLAELADMAALGHRAVMLFLAQRDDATALSIAGDIDPAYAQGFEAAVAHGVEALAYACTVSRTGIRVAEALKVIAIPEAK